MLATSASMTDRFVVSPLEKTGVTPFALKENIHNFDKQHSS
jgi:hypothetical protein